MQTYKAFEIKPVVETAGPESSEEPTYHPFQTLAEAQADLDSFEKRTSFKGLEGKSILWTLYGQLDGTLERIADRYSEEETIALLYQISGITGNVLQRAACYLVGETEKSAQLRVASQRFLDAVSAIDLPPIPGAYDSLPFSEMETALKAAAPAVPGKQATGYIATIQIFIPAEDGQGNKVKDRAQACDYISGLLERPAAGDWAYVAAGAGTYLSPQEFVYNPDTYKEGDFLDAKQTPQSPFSWMSDAVKEPTKELETPLGNV
jgi:hypothetical protein